jgi:hypothetical protein
MPDQSPDSDSARSSLQKSGLGADFGPHIDFAGRGEGPLPESFQCRLEFVPRRSWEAGRGHHDKGTKVDTGQTELDSVYNGKIIENPQSQGLLGEKPSLPFEKACTETSTGNSL